MDSSESFTALMGRPVYCRSGLLSGNARSHRLLESGVVSARTTKKPSSSSRVCVQSLRIRLCLLGIRRDHNLLLPDECRCAVVIGVTPAKVQRRRNTGMDSFIYLLFDCSTSASEEHHARAPSIAYWCRLLVLTCRRRGTSRFFVSPNRIQRMYDSRNKGVVKTKLPAAPQSVLNGSNSCNNLHRGACSWESFQSAWRRRRRRRRPGCSSTCRCVGSQTFVGRCGQGKCLITGVDKGKYNPINNIDNNTNRSWQVCARGMLISTRIIRA